MRFSKNIAILSLLAVTGIASAQDQNNGAYPGPYPPQGGQYPQSAQYPQSGQNPQGGQQAYPQGNMQRYPAPMDYPPQQQGTMPQDSGYRGGYASAAVPAHLTVKPGTYITVRVNQWLSSDRNQTGDAFAASLEQPIVVDGVVVAQRGQTVGGRVSEAEKAGRVQGTSRLGLQLIDLTLVDGQVVPIQTVMVTRNGGTSVGRDAAAVAGTTGLGAAIGAAAGWGRGAAIGAGAGAAAGIVGVLLTRGNPTVIYPESVLTFRIDAPLEIATDHAPEAFRYADANDYQRSGPSGPPAVAGCYNCGPAPVAVRPYPYVAPYPYYPYYGATFGFYSGPGYFVFRGRGYRR